MTAQEQYLTLYKSYENLLREAGKDPRQVEADLETSNPQMAARIRMCRLFRNYLAHENDPGFLVASDKMLDFLSKTVYDLKVQSDCVKQHVKPAGNYIFEANVKCADVLEKIMSTKQTVIVRHDKDGYSLCSVFDIMGLYMASKGAKLSVAKSMRQKVIIVSPTDRFVDLDESRVTICTQDGTADGKLVGFVKFN